jgi:ribonucleoside-diphosphate reductase beta chain
MMAQARNDEINWNDHVCGDTILGISHKSTVEYVGYLANTRLKAVGEGNNIVYNNPYQHLERFADLEDKASTKTNFFEGTPSYTINSLTNWDF